MKPDVITRVVTQKVDVPVPVAREVPPEVEQCRYKLKPPHFEKAPPPGVGLLLPPDQIGVWKSFVAGVGNCDDGWRELSKP